MHAIGIDIGGTKIAGAVVTELGEIVAEDRVATNAADPDAMLDDVVAMVSRLRASNEVSAVGVAAPGFIDASQSIVYYTPNIRWRNEPLRQKLQQRIGDLHITVDNDANAAGWAEFRFGAGRLVSDMTMLTIGTGVGGAIVTEDRLFRGGFGTGGEIGHLRIVPNGLPCGCGARGCIEQYGSGRALQRMANDVADAGGIGQALADARQANGGELDGHIVGDLILADDPARSLPSAGSVGTWARRAPRCPRCSTRSFFVFGGGVASAGDRLLDPIKQAYLNNLPARGYHPEPDFVIAELVNDAGVVGAADLARIHARTA
ncbi:ROK family protein [Curtobacterium flaccumfaciens]|nr:ROK family protein [Curtobacterium flaccumfaciens]